MKEISVTATSGYIYMQVLEDGFLYWEGISYLDLISLVRKIDL